MLGVPPMGVEQQGQGERSGRRVKVRAGVVRKCGTVARIRTGQVPKLFTAEEDDRGRDRMAVQAGWEVTSGASEGAEELDRAVAAQVGVWVGMQAQGSAWVTGGRAAQGGKGRTWMAQIVARAGAEAEQGQGRVCSCCKVSAHVSQRDQEALPRSDTPCSASPAAST